MPRQAKQLLGQADQARERLAARLEGIADAEYLWEPVEGCWNVRRREDSITPEPWGLGVWVYDHASEPPPPEPLTTIAWRLMHLIDVVGGYHMFLWGEGQLEDSWFEVPPDAAGGIALWEQHAGAFLDALRDEDDESLQRMVRIPWWPEECSWARVVGNVVVEMIHHGAEVALLRDLYRRRESWRG
jgi:uncharacterized damage-inducible protein DinB